jgi:hypothetical protein
MKTWSNNVKNAGNQDLNDLDSLIEKMKKRDDQQKKTYRRFYIMMIVFVVFYFLLLVANPDPELTLVHRISGLFYVMAFIIGAWLFRREHRMMVSINYSDPLLQVMKSASERYRPYNKRILPWLLVLLFINLGLTLSGPGRYMPENWTDLQRIVVIQVIYWGIMVISALIGYLLWRVRYRPLWLALKQMVRELEEG